MKLTAATLTAASCKIGAMLSSMTLEVLASQPAFCDAGRAEKENHQGFGYDGAALFIFFTHIAQYSMLRTARRIVLDFIFAEERRGAVFDTVIAQPDDIHGRINHLYYKSFFIR